MTEQTKPEEPDADETNAAEDGGPAFQRTPGKAEGEDPDNPDGRPQDTQADQEENRVSEGQPVAPSAAEDDGGEPNPGR